MNEKRYGSVEGQTRGTLHIQMKKKVLFCKIKVVGTVISKGIGYKLNPVLRIDLWTQLIW